MKRSSRNDLQIPGSDGITLEVKILNQFGDCILEQVTWKITLQSI